MKTTLYIISLLSAASVSNAFADPHIDYARVIDVQPIYERVAHSTPHRECWTESVAYERPTHRPHSATGTIVGTLVGAAIGHQIGHDKRGKKVGRVAGAVLGASIGNDISRKPHHRRHVEYRDEQRCEVRHTTVYKQKLVAYDVSYRYNGSVYHAQTDRHPGKRIKVAVNVSPIF